MEEDEEGGEGVPKGQKFKSFMHVWSGIHKSGHMCMHMYTHVLHTLAAISCPVDLCSTLYTSPVTPLPIFPLSSMSERFSGYT